MQIQNQNIKVRVNTHFQEEKLKLSSETMKLIKIGRKLVLFDLLPRPPDIQNRPYSIKYSTKDKG